MTARIHHYVPQCYLRGFANAATSRLYVVDGAARRIFETTPRNVAAERDFNRIDAEGFALDALEADVAGFEGELASALERIIKKRSFKDPDDRLVILNFIALLAIRNPRHRATFSGFEDGMLKMMAELMVATPERWASQVKQGKEAGIFSDDMDLDYETMKAFVGKGDYRFVTPRMRHIQMELSNFDAVLPYICERKWSLLKARSGTRGFITSDHPVCLMWADPKKRMGFHGPGLGMTGTNLLFPLSSDLALFGRFEGEESERDVDDFVIAGFNTVVITYAERQAYARDDGFLYTRQIHEAPRRGTDLLSDPLFSRPQEPAPAVRPA
jgi:hypothetical protein